MYLRAFLSITLVILMGFTVWTHADVSEYNFEYVKRLNENGLSDMKMSPEISLVYYYKSAIPRLKQFFAEYEKAAMSLNIYKIKLGMYDCTKNSLAECKDEESENFVHAYRSGQKMLEMEMNTVYDVDSLVASSLQLALIGEVPIIQTVEDFNELRNQYSGSKKFVFSYQVALGTFEHRAFIEVAYGYSKKIKFAVTTENEVVSKLFNNFVPKNEKSAVWVVSCKESAEKIEDCKTTRYTGKMSLERLALFVKGSLWPRKFDIPGDGHISPYENEDTHILYLYYNKDCAADVMQKAEFLAREVGSRIGITTINTDEVNMKPAHNYDGATPSVGVKRKGSIFPKFMLTDFTLKNIIDFVLNDMKKDMKRTDAETAMMNDKDKSPKVNVEEVETQDDPVAEAAFRLSGRGLPIKNVCILNDKSFKDKTTQNALTFVVFFYPSCGKSRAVLWAYSEAADKLMNNSSLCVVNCYDWTDVCTKENITNFPTMKYYKNGKTEIYNRPFDTSAIISSFQLLSSPNPVELSSEDMAYTFIDGKQQTVTNDANKLIVVGLFTEEHDKESEVFRSVADGLHGKVQMGIMKSKDSHKVAKKYDTTVPAVIIFKPEDVIEPFFARSFDFSPETLHQFIKEKRFHVVPELSALMFPALFSKGFPFVILFTSDKEEEENEKKLFTEVAMSFEGRNLTFCYMPITQNHAVNHIIKKAYGVGGSTPAVSFVHHNEGLVFNLERELTQENMVDWLEKAMIGDLRPSSLLPKGEWKPKSDGYNFLEMMDYEKRTGRLMFEEDLASEEEIRQNEELGVGFDSDGNYLGVEEDYVPPKEDEVDEIKEPESERWKSAKTRHQHLKEKQDMAGAHEHTEL